MKEFSGKSDTFLTLTYSFDLFAGTFNVLESHLYVTYNRQGNIIKQLEVRMGEDSVEETRRGVG